MEKKEIKLRDWLNGECPYKGCVHNDGYGRCEFNDEDFIQSQLQKVKDMYLQNREVLKNKTFICSNFDIIGENHCEYCGAKMQKIVDKLPYGDTSFPFIYYECNKC